MSEHDTPSDRELLRALSQALTDAGELVPTDEAEVLRAEQRGAEEVPLPERLRQPRFDEAPADTRRPADVAAASGAYRARRAWLSHGLAVALGAAAAAAVVLALPDAPGDAGAPLGSDPDTATSAAEAPPALALTLPEPRCDACCAGADCASAGELQRCSSGRRCIPCDARALMGSRYRLRVGAVAPAELGVATLAAFPQGEPEICLRPGVSAEICVPTRITDSQQGNWNALPLVVSAEDLAAKLSLRLRWKGVEGPRGTAATWTMPVALTPRSLCHGYTVKLENEHGELFGTMSLFMDDTHYVELMRAGDTAALRAHRARFRLSGVSLALMETREPGAQRFALIAGPYDLATAEALRWQLLEQQQPATLSVGPDYAGAAKPLH